MFAQLNNRRGIALVVALFAMVVIAALVTGSFFAGHLEQQSGRNTVYGAQALAAAEWGLSDVLAGADLERVQAMPVGGGPLDLGTATAGAGLTMTRLIVRLTSVVFLVRSTGTRRNADGGVLATRTLGLLVQLLPASEAAPPRLAALPERAWIQLW
jgi:hypothetical protein